jgi:UDP-N-acetylmuramate dehydrogenase
MREKLDAATVAGVIEEIRWSKLPRPEEMGSAGSFFKNPVVTAEKFEELAQQHPDMPAHLVDDGFKLAAGWLIDRCGWKGRTMGRCGVYERQALVLVNRGGCSGSEVRQLADAIMEDVRRKFGVTLECEAEFVGMEPTNNL